MITRTTPWNGLPVVLGDRVYLANGSVDQIQCYDYGSAATCPNFPRSTNLGAQGSAGYIYTVNPDPQRPECLWVNADYGSAQLQNFDAFTGGPCGSGAIRVLASSIVAPTAKCAPDVYTSLRILSPGRSGYVSGSVSFVDGDGQPLPGLAARSLDDTGAVSLSDLDLTSDTGLPQFLIALDQTGETNLNAVTVELTWTGDADAVCTPTSSVRIDPVHGLTGETFTARYSCPVDPVVTVTRPDGSPPDGVTVGLKVTGNNLDYNQPIKVSQPGDLVVNLSCNGNESKSVVFDAVGPVNGTFGPGWPQAPDGSVNLVYSYGGTHQYLGNIVQAAKNWNETRTNIEFTAWTGDATPVDLSVADVTWADDLWGITLSSTGFGGMLKSYDHNYVYLNTRTLDRENDAIRTKVSTHELGHALSLTHPNDAGFTRATGPDSVMWQGRLAFSKPQDFDVRRLEQRYP